MKTKLLFAATLILALCASGCVANRTTSTGGKETSVFAGALTISENSFQPTNPATIDLDTSKASGKSGPSGSTVSVLWGLFKFHDY
jgi:hypothetical protein